MALLFIDTYFNQSYNIKKIKVGQSEECGFMQTEILMFEFKNSGRY